MSSDINDKLSRFFREGQNWDKKPTNIEGVFLLKLPASKQSPSSVAIEVNPINATSDVEIQAVHTIFSDNNKI